MVLDNSGRIPKQESLFHLNKIRDLLKVKLYTVRSETKKREIDREREREKERKKREREASNIY